jgi:hypothetical protein
MYCPRVQLNDKHLPGVNDWFVRIVVLLLSSTGDDSDHERMSEGEYIH